MALDADMTRWVNLQIFDKLAACCEMMNLNGSDRKVYEMCRNDFWNYITFLETNYAKYESIDIKKSVSMEFHVEQNYGVVNVFTYVSEEETKEIEEFVSLFVKQWWKKYHERCKIVFHVEREPLKTLGEFPVNAFTAEEQKEICREVTNAFIKNGEICCPSILAEQIFKKKVETSKRKDWKTEDKLNLLSQLTREAKQISYTHGTLIFIKAGKDFYTREWRNDGSVNKIV